MDNIREENDKYRVQYEKLKAYSEEMHRSNQHRIRVGVRLNIILPLFFLILSFINTDSKLIFLIFWIISLFGIAFYLMFVEYSDYNLQEKMKEFGVKEQEENNDVLLGHTVIAASDATIDKVDRIDEKLTGTKNSISEAIGSTKQAAIEKIKGFKNPERGGGDA